RYPVRLAFTTRMGNSSLFRDITGLNFQYSNRDFKNMLLNKASHWDAGRLKQLEALQELRSRLEEKAGAIQRLKSSIAGPSKLRQVIEAKERALYAAGRDSLLSLPGFSVEDININNRMNAGWRKIRVALPHGDTSLQRIKDEHAVQKATLDSLQKEYAQLGETYQQAQKAYGLRKRKLAEVLQQSRNNKELADNLRDMDLPDTVLPKGYKTLLAIRSVGIGRTLVNYSELTARDISILGLQAEYNPSYYVAFATGMVDYRFRNFIVNENRSRQYLNLVRIGAGMKEGNNIILTYY